MKTYIAILILVLSLVKMNNSEANMSASQLLVVADSMVKEKNYNGAIKILNDLAYKNNDIKAIKTLIQIYRLDGAELGNNRDFNQEMERNLARKGATLGDSDLQYQLAKFYLTLDNNVENRIDIKYWLNQAIAAKHSGAMLMMGELLMKEENDDYKCEALMYMQKSYKLNFKEAKDVTLNLEWANLVNYCDLDTGRWY